MIYRDVRPRMGLVIGTYSALPQVHLQLESWRRFCPGMPLLVIDDCSPSADVISRLCAEYGVDFECNGLRLGHVPGDMTVFVKGMRWAAMNNLDLLVKFSRRWVPLVSWKESLGNLAFESQAVTFSSICKFHGFGFRSECVAMHVPSWSVSDGVARMRKEIRRGEYVLVEGVVHQCAKDVAREHSNARWDRYEKENPSPEGAGGYAVWNFMGESRTRPRSDLLWHEWARAHEYHRALLQWGITRYGSGDMLDEAANIKNR